jgi:hypothetical protein
VPAEPAPQSPPTPALPIARVALAYDELPAGSDLRREFGPDGSVTITAPAGEPSPALRRSMARDTAIYGAAFCAGPMAVLLWAAWPLVARLDFPRRVTAMGLGVVLAGGIFLLVWKVWYGAHFDLVAKARREAAVLHADARGLLIETTGPEGPQSVEVPASEAIRISVVGWRFNRVPIPHIRIERPHAPAVRLLTGRDPAELRWVAATLAQALGRPDE